MYQNAHTIKFRQGAKRSRSHFFNAAPVISQDFVWFFVMKLVKCVTREKMCCSVLMLQKCGICVHISAAHGLGWMTGDSDI